VTHASIEENHPGKSIARASYYIRKVCRVACGVGYSQEPCPYEQVRSARLHAEYPLTYTTHFAATLHYFVDKKQHRLCAVSRRLSARKRCRRSQELPSPSSFWRGWRHATAMRHRKVSTCFRGIVYLECAAQFFPQPITNRSSHLHPPKTKTNHAHAIAQVRVISKRSTNRQASCAGRIVSVTSRSGPT
jgi:hypothetical protein